MREAQQQQFAQEILAVADLSYPKMRAVILQGIAKLQGETSLHAVAASLAQTPPDWSGATAGINWEAIEEIRPQIGDIILDTFRKGAMVKPPGGILRGVGLDVTNPQALLWVRDHTGEMITGIVKDSQAGIQRAVQALTMRAFREGLHPYEQARLLRNYIGLTPSAVAAAESYHKFLDDLAAGSQGGKLPALSQEATKKLKSVGGLTTAKAGLTSEKIADLTTRYTQKKIAERATLIARTETLKASNMGQSALHAQAMARGYITDQDSVRTWILTPDDRLCPVCAKLLGDLAPIIGVFHRAGIMAPPLHPACRCCTGLRKKTTEDFDYLATPVPIVPLGKDWGPEQAWLKKKKAGEKQSQAKNAKKDAAQAALWSVLIDSPKG